MSIFGVSANHLEGMKEQILLGSFHHLSLVFLNVCVDDVKGLLDGFWDWGTIGYKNKIVYIL
jgi:hypothetical protein